MFISASKNFYRYPQINIILGINALSLLSFNTQAKAPEQIWQHSGQPALVVELFTSEGCSSCPPADTYLKDFVREPNLWRDIIPMAYHVDYWDGLGWKDPFARPEFSLRQNLYKAYGQISSVYTPGFVVNGQEWRGFFQRRPLPQNNAKNSPPLLLQKTGAHFQLTYQQEQEYTAHFVLLSMQQSSEVTQGENKGKRLQHEFIVLLKDQKNAVKKWNFDYHSLPQNADAVAVWLTPIDSFQPIQTVAGWIK